MKKQSAENICSMVDEILNQMQTLNNYVIENCERSQLERITPALAL
jgi:uncharacterized protein YfkK (UPF0435 family)